MKKRNVNNLRLNKTQISHLRGGTKSQDVITNTQGCNYSGTCPSINDDICLSRLITCISELPSACGCATREPWGCEVPIAPVGPSFLKID